MFCRQTASQLHVFALNQLKCNNNDQSNCFNFHINNFHLNLVLTSFLFPLRFVTTSLCALFSATCHYQSGSYQISFLFLHNKTNRCTKFPNLFCHETLHVSDSSSVHHQDLIHCTLNNGMCHTSCTHLLSCNRMEKKHHQVFLKAYKSRNNKYRVQAKRKQPYWQIN